MDPLSIIVAVASAVVAGVITDLISGKSKTARRDEIERQVALELQKRADEYDFDKTKHTLDELAKLKQQILDEVDILSARHSDLRVSSDTIELRHSPKTPLFGREAAVNKELTSRLSELDTIVKQRRLALGLPTTEPTRDKDSTATSSPNELEVHEPETVQGTQENENNPRSTLWAHELEEMERRIAERRRGDDTSK